MLFFFIREYGAIDDVDIDLHIDVSFLDVSVVLTCTHSVVGGAGSAGTKNTVDPATDFTC